MSPASGSNGRTVLAIVLVLIGTAYVIYSIWRTPPGGGERGEHHPAAGRTLFFVSLRSVDDGRLVGLTDFAGKVTLLNFWGTWCPPCREELPRLQVLAQEFATHEDFAVAAVSYPFGEDVDPRTLATETRQFLDATGLKLPVYLDVDNQTMTAADLIVGVPGFPTTIILDRSGKIRGVWNGYQRGYEQEMHEFVARLLAEPYQVSMPELTITGQEYLVPLEGEEPPP
ncbi:MAG: TlpA family protein disulfide reductase [Pirellulales bacterium]|nr:TlpA family protein disulfide reductase [Pirellulales bacterium]